MDLICLKHVGICQRYSWKIPKRCLRVALDIPDKHTTYAQNIHMIFLRYGWDMKDLCLRNTLEMPEICLRYAWDIPDICVRNTLNMPEIFLK